MSDLSILAARRMYGGGDEADMLRAMAARRGYQRIYKYAVGPGEHRKLYKGCLEADAPPPTGERYHDVLLVFDQGEVKDLENDSLWDEAEGSWARTWGSHVPSKERVRHPGAEPTGIRAVDWLTEQGIPRWTITATLAMVGLGVLALAVGLLVL